MKIIFSVILIMLFGCRSADREQAIPIPKDAVWIGGIDGGCWVLFGQVTENAIKATIFHENGEIWEKGIFRKTKNFKIDTIDITKKITGFDGKRLLTGTYCSFEKEIIK